MNDMETLAALFAFAALGGKPRYHKHQCGECGHIWGHGGEHEKKPLSHICSKCNAGPWYDHYRK